MPRTGRVVLPHVPHHVVQRGHNRQVVFAGVDDYARYVENLRELSAEFDLRVHAYCLMTNHVHLLLTPSEAVAGMGRLMKALAARTTRYRNRLEGRSRSKNGRCATDSTSWRSSAILTWIHGSNGEKRAIVWRTSIRMPRNSGLQRFAVR